MLDKVLNFVGLFHGTDLGKYEMENRVPFIIAPTLVLAGTDDPSSSPRMRILADSIRGSRTYAIRGGMVPMVDQMPEEFAKVVIDFLDKT